MNRYSYLNGYKHGIVFPPTVGDRVRPDLSKIKHLSYVDENTRGVILNENSNGMEVRWDGDEDRITTYWSVKWLLHE